VDNSRRLGRPTDEAAAIFEEGRCLAEESGDVQALAALHGTYAHSVRSSPIGPPAS
jgi:hypothetical protein